MVQLVCSRDHKIVSGEPVRRIRDRYWYGRVCRVREYGLAWVCRAVSACVSLCGVCVCGDAYAAAREDVERPSLWIGRPIPLYIGFVFEILRLERPSLCERPNWDVGTSWRAG